MNNNDFSKRILNRFSALYVEIQEYITRCGAAGYARINVKLLGKALVDYFEDIERLKLYEGMERVNEAKVYAYQTFWLMRRKPIQIIEQKDFPETGLYLNEFIFACMLVSAMYKEAGLDTGKKDKRRMDFIDLLEYNFKYRTYTQKSLELMVEAFLLSNKVD